MTDSVKSRDSNIELLRILCMFMVVVHHFLVRGISIAPWTPGLSNDSTTIIGTILDQFCYCAVNVFVLISGYFGIKCKVKGVASLYVRCALYGLICWLVGTLIDGGSPGRYGFTINCLLSLSHTRWFIAAYLCLYLLSPVLNICIEQLTKEKFIYVLAILTLLNVYFGWFQNASYNPTGYCTAQFVYLYFIGRYLSIFKISPSRSKCLATYLGCAVFLGIVVLLLYFSKGENKWQYLFGEKYNNPILIVEAAALLLLFRSFNFQSNAINRASKSVLAIYLIHTNPNIDERIYSYFGSLWQTWPDGFRWVYLLLSGLFVIVSCIVIDKAMTFIIKPVTSLLTKCGDWIVGKIRLVISTTLACDKELI